MLKSSSFPTRKSLIWKGKSFEPKLHLHGFPCSFSRVYSSSSKKLKWLQLLILTRTFWPDHPPRQFHVPPKPSKSALYVFSLKAWKVGPQPQRRPKNFQHLPSSSFQVTLKWVFFFRDLKSGVKTWPPPFSEKIKRSLGRRGYILGGGFHFLNVHLYLGKIPILTSILYFSNGSKPRFLWKKSCTKLRYIESSTRYKLIWTWYQQ